MKNCYMFNENRTPGHSITSNKMLRGPVVDLDRVLNRFEQKLINCAFYFVMHVGIWI